MATEVQTIICSLTKFHDDCEIHHHHIPSAPLLITLKATKLYQTWYTQSNVGVVGIYRSEYKRNHIDM